MHCTDLYQRVKRITITIDKDCTLLTAEGIKTEDDTRLLEFQDLLDTISVMRRRNLNIVGK